MKEHHLPSGSVDSSSLNHSSLAPNRTMLGNTKYLLTLWSLILESLRIIIVKRMSIRSQRMVFIFMDSIWMELGGIQIFRLSMNSSLISCIAICHIFISLLLSTHFSKKNKRYINHIHKYIYLYIYL